MFSLTIYFGPAATMWTLMWRDEETARAAFTHAQNREPNSLILTDEFGQCCDIERADIRGVMFEDMEKSKLAHIERALYQSRMQAKAAEMAQNDPVLRAARFQQGPSTLVPGGLNGFPR